MTFFEPSTELSFQEKLPPPPQTLEGQLNPTGRPRICLLGEVTAGAVNWWERCNSERDQSPAAGVNEPESAGLETCFRWEKTTTFSR